MWEEVGKNAGAMQRDSKRGEFDTEVEWKKTKKL